LIRVSVQLMGTLMDSTGKSVETLVMDAKADVSSVIDTLIKLHGEHLEIALIDPIVGNPLPNALVLVNGVEIGNIQGLSTPLQDGDAVVLLPVTHGG
jgi:molybdopterin converting factor small subunit